MSYSYLYHNTGVARRDELSHSGRNYIYSNIGIPPSHRLIANRSGIIAQGGYSGDGDMGGNYSANVPFISPLIMSGDLVILAHAARGGATEMPTDDGFDWQWLVPRVNGEPGRNFVFGRVPSVVPDHITVHGVGRYNASIGYVVIRGGNIVTTPVISSSYESVPEANPPVDSTLMAVVSFGTDHNGYTPEFRWRGLEGVFSSPSSHRLRVGFAYASINGGEMSSVSGELTVDNTYSRSGQLISFAYTSTAPTLYQNPDSVGREYIYYRGGQLINMGSANSCYIYGKSPGGTLDALGLH